MSSTDSISSVGSDQVQSILKIALLKIKETMDKDEDEFFVSKILPTMSQHQPDFTLQTFQGARDFFWAMKAIKKDSARKAFYEGLDDGTKKSLELFSSLILKKNYMPIPISSWESDIIPSDTRAKLVTILSQYNDKTLGSLFSISPDINNWTTSFSLLTEEDVSNIKNLLSRKPPLSGCKYTRAEALVKQLPPLMLWGPPGIGKSAMIVGVAKELGIDLVDIRLAQKDPTDMKGLPVPNKKSMQVEWYLSSEWPREINSRGIIFFDELTAADKAIQVAAYEIILDRKLGDVGEGKVGYKVPPGWFICAAGNERGDQAVSEGMSSALANRFLHLTVKPDTAAWLNWAETHGIHTYVVQFIQDNPDLLHDMSENFNLQQGWPSPRSWERVSHLIKAYEDCMLKLQEAVYLAEVSYEDRVKKDPSLLTDPEFAKEKIRHANTLQRIYSFDDFKRDDMINGLVGKSTGFTTFYSKMRLVEKNYENWVMAPNILGNNLTYLDARIYLGDFKPLTSFQRYNSETKKVETIKPEAFDGFSSTDPITNLPHLPMDPTHAEILIGYKRPGDPDYDPEEIKAKEYTDSDYISPLTFAEFDILPKSTKLKIQRSPGCLVVSIKDKEDLPTQNFYTETTTGILEANEIKKDLKKMIEDPLYRSGSQPASRVDVIKEVNKEFETWLFKHPTWTSTQASDRDITLPSVQNNIVLFFAKHLEKWSWDSEEYAIEPSPYYTLNSNLLSARQDMDFRLKKLCFLIMNYIDSSRIAFTEKTPQDIAALKDDQDHLSKGDLKRLNGVLNVYKILATGSGLLTPNAIGGGIASAGLAVYARFSQAQFSSVSLSSIQPELERLYRLKISPDDAQRRLTDGQAPCLDPEIIRFRLFYENGCSYSLGHFGNKRTASTVLTQNTTLRAGSLGLTNYKLLKNIDPSDTSDARHDSFKKLKELLDLPRTKPLKGKISIFDIQDDEEGI